MATPQKVKGKLVTIMAHGEGVYSLIFSLPKRFTRFKPGQFTHFTLDEFDPTMGYWPESRVFSIASEPKTDQLRIVYSVKGAYTSRMQKELVEGDEYWLKLPYGDFTIEEQVSENQEIVMVAGGTGIAPFIPYLINGNKKFPDKPVVLYYGFRKINHMLFSEELQHAKSTMPNLDIIYCSEDYLAQFKVGKLNIDDICAETKMMSNPVYFLSGPPTMINSFKNRMNELGIKQENIKIDEWV